MIYNYGITMTRTVKRPREVPDTLQRRGRTYKKRDISTNRKELKREAKHIKKSNPKSHYVINKYKNVKVRSGPFGKLKKKTLYALFFSY